jgi:dsRNA-specific ribonuclease
VRLIDADKLKKEIENYFIDKITKHKYNVDCVDCNAELQELLADQEKCDVREKTIEDSKEAVAKEICIGCGYLKETECTYTGQNCRTSKPMLKATVKALDKLKAGNK